jgi:hypothetical protein
VRRQAHRGRAAAVAVVRLSFICHTASQWAIGTATLAVSSPCLTSCCCCCCAAVACAACGLCCCWPADINACVANDCTDGDGIALCADMVASAGGRNDAAGRTCSCRVSGEAGAALDETRFYANDTAGCIGERPLTSCCRQCTDRSSESSCF